MEIRNIRNHIAVEFVKIKKAINTMQTTNIKEVEKMIIELREYENENFMSLDYRRTDKLYEKHFRKIDSLINSLRKILLSKL